MTFIEEFIKRGNITFEGMRGVACDLLKSKSKYELDKLYDELERGKCIINDEDHLNAYLRSFGKMHMAKLDYAFHNFPKISQFFQHGVEIFDWGCGQGIATFCLFDYLKLLVSAKNTNGHEFFPQCQ